MFASFRCLSTAWLISCLFITPLFAQTFSAPKRYGTFTDAFQMVAAGFDRNGAADLVGVANLNNGSETSVVVYMNTGRGTFNNPITIAGTTGATAVAVGDFNQDGNLDIAFTLSTAAQVGVAYGNGKGGFATPRLYAVDGLADSIAVGDYDDDGKPDIATLSDASKRVTILRNTGQSFIRHSFTVPLYYSSTNAGYPPDTVSGLVSGDFNGNHQTDLAYLDRCADISCGPGLSRIYSLMNAHSTITPYLVPNQIGGNATLSAADVDLDGKADLLVSAVGNGFGEAYVEYSNGGGSFTQVYLNDDRTSAGLPNTLLVGDFNSDGIEDVATYTDTDAAGNPDYGFDIYTGKGGRSGFNAPAHFADNTNVSLRGGFAAGFLNADGTRDVALIDGTSLAVFLNTTSTAKDPCAYPSGTGLHNCGPRNGGSGPASIQVLDAYKASAQPALRIEFWADGHKLFQEYGDLLNTTWTLSAGTHHLSVVGVDATGKYIKSNTTYTAE
ncbi:MAG TPA: VCBS repeat-containing protein [Verrucomicrobiae bacterium]|nr:VCBS repeat-containing protein [Verrucomicrobiae bacterium]